MNIYLKYTETFYKVHSQKREPYERKHQLLVYRKTVRIIMINTITL